MAKSRQQKIEEQFATMFTDMDPIESEPAAEPTTKATQNAPETSKKTTVKKSAKTTTKHDTATQKKPQKKLYTISLDIDIIRKLKKYSAVKQATIGDIVTNAIMQYMKKYPVTDEEREAYEAKRKAEDIDI